MNMNGKKVIEITTREGGPHAPRIYSRTGNTKQRITHLKLNIAASKGKGSDSMYFKRFDVFKDIPESEIVFNVYSYTATVWAY